VLRQILKDFPHLKRIFEKSDNAGCFKNWTSIQFRQQMAKEFGISFERLDFNDPCSGEQNLSI